MRHVVLVILSSWFLLSACDEMPENMTKETPTSENAFYPYFYQYDTIPKIYVYRDLVDGLTEQFHRVFGIKDSQGEHIVVEIYDENRNLLEATNYALDSLNVLDQMMIDFQTGEKKATSIGENDLIPMVREDISKFTSIFQGPQDSTLFMQEIERSFAIEADIEIMDKAIKTIVLDEKMSLTLMNPFTKEEGTRIFETKRYFAKDLGLVEWHSLSKSQHYRLEKIMSQTDFVNIMSKE
ncbi:MAG: hypothetical protein MK066_02080 [Crocinitomicaceae bacterium]|nr:hypothetical protein [Crocinitomicaceae bacterium]